MNDEKKVSIRLKELLGVIRENYSNKISVIEIGPGKNSDTIINLSKSKYVDKAYAFDINEYFSNYFWVHNHIEFFYKNLSEIESLSMDFVYLYDVLEHVKNPRDFLIEIKRIMKKDSLLFIPWDLRDHFYIHNERRWFDMHKYCDFIWSLQMSNRVRNGWLCVV